MQLLQRHRLFWQKMKKTYDGIKLLKYVSTLLQVLDFLSAAASAVTAATAICVLCAVAKRLVKA